MARSAPTTCKAITATLHLHRLAISVYANELTAYGTATFSIDGGSMQTVTLSPANSSPNGAGAGNVLVYTVSGLGAGTHTLQILNNAASNVISDRSRANHATADDPCSSQRLA